MTKTSTSNDSFKLDRKTIERNRRIHIKTLFHQLASHIPSNFKPSNSKSKYLAAQQDQLGLAARYIKHMKERIDKLKKQKEQAMRTLVVNRKMFNSSNSQLPLLELRDFGSCIEVVLVTGLNNNNNNNNKTFMFYQVISVLEEEGAQVVTATFTTVGDKIFYTLHAQVKISRLGVETTRIYHRLREFIAPLASKLRIIRLNA